MNDSSLIARQLSTMRLVACAAPSYLAVRGAPRHPRDLATHDCVIDSNVRNPRSWVFIIDGARRSMRVNGRFSLNSALAARTVLLAGGGIGLAPSFVVEEDLRTGRLLEVLHEYCHYRRGIYAVYPHRRHLPGRVRLLLDFLCAHFAQDAPNRPPSTGMTVPVM